MDSNRNIFQRIHQLKMRLLEADRAYYQKYTPILTDKEYDSYLEELRSLEQKMEIIDYESPTQRIGELPSENLPTVTHHPFLLSLNNTYNEEELRAFDQRIKKKLSNRTFSYFVELKFDGMAINLQYKNGILKLGATRGNGQQGR